MTKRLRILAFGSATVLILAGIAAVAISSDTLGQVLALVLISIGVVLAVSLVFFEVGLSEDRERAREAAADQPPKPRRARPRLRRLRGEQRRLK